MPDFELVVELIIGLSWPLVALIGFWILSKSVVSIVELLNGKDIKLSAKGVDIVIENVAKKVRLSPMQHEELKELTAHDIWALESINKDDIYNNKKYESLNSLPLALKVAVKTFIGLRMVEIKNHKPVVTTLGKEILLSAENILEDCK